MDRNQFTRSIDERIKLIRTEYGLTQEKMADVLGISKKTLIQIEKGRQSVGWTGSVAVASIFADSVLLREMAGGDISEIIIALSFNDVDVSYPKTWGGRLWWETIFEKDNFRIQQNIFSRHYRILDGTDRRRYTTFSLDEVKDELENLIKSSSHE